MAFNALFIYCQTGVCHRHWESKITLRWRWCTDAALSPWNYEHNSLYILTPSRHHTNCPVPSMAVTETGIMLSFFCQWTKQGCTMAMADSCFFFWSISISSQAEIKQEKPLLDYQNSIYRPEILKTQLHRTSFQYPSTLSFTDILKNNGLTLPIYFSLPSMKFCVLVLQFVLQC